MRLLVAAGGTGGTVIPGIAVAREAMTLEPKSESLFVGTSRGFETKLVPAAGFALELIRVGGLKRKSLWERVRGLLVLPAAFSQSWNILSRFKPQVVFGTGGYASGPILLLAAFRRKPTAILEPNSVPGMANRLLARFVDRVFLAFEEAQGQLPRRKCVYSGNPMREDILSVPPPSFDGDERTILVFGGSQGARRLNEAMIFAAPKLRELSMQLRILHQTGSADEDRVRKAYAQAGLDAEVFAFRDDMAEVYRRSHLIVARSGSSVLEIGACGRPSILVPYPSAADDHQRENARIFQRAGAAISIEDEECTGDRLAKELMALLPDRERLISMSQKALFFRKADAAKTIARQLATMCEGIA